LVFALTIKQNKQTLNINKEKANLANRNMQRFNCFLNDDAKLQVESFTAF